MTQQATGREVTALPLKAQLPCAGRTAGMPQPGPVLHKHHEVTGTQDTGQVIQALAETLAVLKEGRS